MLFYKAGVFFLRRDDAKGTEERGRQMKKKRALIMMLLAALFVTAMPAVTLPMEVHAVSDPGSCPGHHWVEKDSFPATCVNSGQTTYQCSICGGWKSENHAPTGRHTWGPVPGSTQAPGADGWITEAEATCTAGGRQFRNCSHCGSREDRTTNALGHAYDSGTVTKEASCTEEGVKTFTCTRCNETKTEQIATKGHNYQTNVTRQATCTQEGEKETKCTVCGDTKKEAIPKIAHNYQTTVTKEATCTADGTKTTKCTLCGETKTEAIPKLGHNYQETVTKQPTCTAEGEKQTKCTRCNDTKTEKIAALGHDWNRSVTRDPEGFIDGESVATCRRCGEEETQTLSAGVALFGKLRNLPLDGMQDAEELVIVDQTEGEFDISHETGGSVPLSVTVEGGVAPYTYTWYSVKLKSGTLSAIHSALQSSKSMKIRDTYASIGSKVKESFSAAMQSAGKMQISYTIPNLNGMVNKGSIISGEGSSTSGKKENRLPLGHQKLQEGDSPSCDATLGEHAYYCVVKDAVGNKVTSEEVTVYWVPYFIVQPENGNLHDGPVTFTAKLAGGRPLDGEYNYWYYWYREDGSIVRKDEAIEMDWENGIFTTDVPGSYYCIGADDFIEEDIISRTATAYEAEPLTVSCVGDNVVHVYPGEGDSATLEFEYKGGVSPYTTEWIKNEGEGENGAPTTETTFSRTVNAAEASERGDAYTLRVRDAMGAVAEAKAYVCFNELKIVTQPEGTKLPPEGGKHTAIIEIDRGEAAFTYQLIRGQEIVEIKTGGNHMSFEISQSGTYEIYVTDAKGRYARSNEFAVEDYGFQLKNYPERILATDQYGGDAKLVVEVEGGEAPYRFIWSKLYVDESDKRIWYQSPWGDLREDAVFTQDTRKTSAHITPGAPGLWECTVQDKNGATVTTKPMEVVWDRYQPYITVHPERIGYGDTKPATLDLHCAAVGRDGTDKELIYRWEILIDGTWTNYDAWVTAERNKNAAHDYNPESAFGKQLRCVVTDRKWGTSTISRTGGVYRKKMINIATLEDGQIVNGQIGYSRNGRILFQGGLAPYTVKVERYLTDPYGNRSVWTSGQHCLKKVTEKGEMVELTFEKLDLYQNVAPHGKIPYTYRVTVTDARGSVISHEFTCKFY